MIIQSFLLIQYLCLIYTKTITIPLSSSSNLNYLDYTVSSSAFFSFTKNVLSLMKICIGTPSQCFAFAIDTSSSVTFLQSSKSPTKSFNITFDETSSSTYESTEDSLSFYYMLKSLQHYIVKDVISIKDKDDNALKQKDKFVFCILKDTEKIPLIELGGFIGFSKFTYYKEEFNKYQFSLAKYFGMDIFSLSYSINGTGVITGGELSFTESIAELPFCDSTDSKDPTSPRGWHCQTEMIQYGDFISNYTAHVYFQSIFPIIQVPNSIGVELFNHIISKTGNKCISLTEHKKKILRCDEDFDLNKLENIKIFFESKNGKENYLELHTKLMFEFIHQTIDNKYYYILKMIVSSIDDIAFVLGEPAFVNNDISFNTNTNIIISFFSKPNIPITRRIIPKEVSSFFKNNIIYHYWYYLCILCLWYCYSLYFIK